MLQELAEVIAILLVSYTTGFGRFLSLVPSSFDNIDQENFHETAKTPSMKMALTLRVCCK